MTLELALNPGAKVSWRGSPREVVSVLDLESVVLVDDRGQKEIVRLADVGLPQNSNEAAAEVSDIHDASEQHWQTAHERARLIEPLLHSSRKTVADVQRAADEHGVSRATVYRWIRQFERTSTVASLLPEKRSGGLNKSRINPEVEDIIQHYIKEHYLTRQKPKASVIVEVVRAACLRAKLPAPHGNTVRARLRRIPGRISAKQRGDKRALESYTPTPGQLPGADYPLDMYQIDHTPVDAEIVDEIHRLPIGRPWITMAIDCNSRMAAGFAVLLEPPSALSVGLAITHAIMPKEEWLAKRGIDQVWPVYGRPKVIHADNGADFRCEAVTRGCQNHRIDIAWRPVKKAHWGGHIERLLGTVATKLKTLPGATFSNPRERGQYNSGASAQLTLSELERWVADLLLGKYHNDKHSSLETTPLRRFEEGIHGTKTRPGRGLPPRPMDGRTLLIDFLPAEMRTVQATGLTLDNVRYYSPALAPWVGARDDKNRKLQFRVHRDPRAISPVYFYDPERKEYIDVPYADLSLPIISLGELRASRRELIRSGRKAINEEAIFRAAESMRRIETEAAEKSRKARRNQQRRHSRQASLEAFPTATPATRERTLAAEPIVEHRSATEVVTAYDIEEFDE